MEDLAKFRKVVATIVEHTKRFATFWHDEHGGIVALPAGPRVDCALIVRPDRWPARFRTADGRIAAVVGDDWAMVGMHAAPPQPRHEGTVGFAGYADRRSAPEILAAFAELRGKRLASATKGSRLLFGAVLGPDAVQELPRSHQFALALRLRAPEVRVVFDPMSPVYSWLEEVEIERAIGNAEAIETWGVPPPEAGTALKSYVHALVARKCREPPDAENTRGTRGDLVRALRLWAADLPCSYATTPDGGTWRVYRVPRGRVREMRGLRAIAFPEDIPPGPRAEVLPGLRVAPAHDVAVLADTHALRTGLLGRGTEDITYGVLTAHISRHPKRPARPDWVTLAATLVSAEIRREGPTVVVEGVYLPRAHVDSPFFPRPI